ncbi:MAG: HAMP domain-containing histidine kinase [Candidatus Ancillula sp.]|jgi:signal transduction histidine kinase|nr:HAMP domain-containing histidine kinase [Candidatus Ancillula sp.]
MENVKNFGNKINREWVKIVTNWNKLKVHVRITITMVALLTGGLIISSSVTFALLQVTLKKDMEKRVQARANSAQDGILGQLEQMYGGAPKQPDFSKDMSNGLMHDLNSTLIAFFIISTICLVVLGGLAAYFVAKKSLKQVEDENVRVNQFIQNASHDLRTPLTVIKGYSELYNMQKESITKEQVDELFQKIETNSNRMNDLIENMLVLARLDNSKIDSSNSKAKSKKGLIVNSFEDVDLKKCLQLEVDNLKVLSLKRPVRLNLDPEDGNFVIKSDKVKILSVFDNIIQNINRYTPENSAVIFTLKKIDSKYIGIRISDFGPGVPKEMRSKIFDRFVKLDNSRKEVGNGLGLSIVKENIVSLGGTIKTLATSIVDGKEIGLTYDITLPL